MSDLLRFSDAASLAFHATAFLAREPERPRPVAHMAALLQCSEAHLSKVMQRLARANIVASTRGPKGGYRLQGDPAKVALLEVYVAIDGPLDKTQCMLGEPRCVGSDCVLGDLLRNVHAQVFQYLSETHLADLTQVYDGLNTCHNCEESNE